MGFAQVSVSHEVSPLIKLVGRGDTTVVDAYLSPILRALCGAGGRIATTLLRERASVWIACPIRRAALRRGGGRV